MSSSDYYFITTLNNIITCIYKYILPIFYITGNIGNLLSIFVFFKKSWSKNVCVLYFKICLFLSLIYINTTVLAALLYLGFTIDVYDSSIILCKFLYYISHLISTLLPTILILATIDRLLISSRNVDTRLYSSKRLAYFSIGLSTFFWSMFNSHVLIQINMQQFGPFYFLCYYDLSAFYLTFVFYSVMINNTLICLLIIILSALAFKNIQHIRTVPRQQRKQIRSMTKKDFQLLRCLFAQDIVYISLGFLLCIYFIYTAITKDTIRPPLEQAIVNFFNSFFSFFYYIFYCDSFFIFFFASKMFRHELKRMIYKVFGTDIIPLREEENRREIELNVVPNCIILQT